MNQSDRNDFRLSAGGLAGIRTLHRTQFSVTREDVAATWYDHRALFAFSSHRSLPSDPVERRIFGQSSLTKCDRENVCTSVKGKLGGETYTE